MEPALFNDILSRLDKDKGNARDHILDLAVALIEWMGFPFAESGKPRLLDFQTIKLKEALAPAPITGQEQLYRLTADGLPIRIRFAVLKKYDKKIVHYLVDNNVGLSSYQASMRGIKQIEGREPYIAQQPYFVHFITTAKYDRLWVVFNESDQKRILIFRNRLSQTQYNKILPAWRNIASKTKPELAKLFWESLDVKEVNKEFYRHIKEQFDALIGIAKTQTQNFPEEQIKQFAVRLIGRYIFCWFLKEKEIIPEALISSKTIEQFKESYFQKLLTKLFFKTLNTEVTDPARNETLTELEGLYKNIPYLNGGLFEWHPDDVLFEKIDLNAWLIVFVKVLESFDFTVDESSSQYQQVAIDPEMLGRIFENLLASQNPDTEKMANQRKAFGAFYTPREIVDYMVNESLKAYVETQLLPQLPAEANRVNEPEAELKGTLFHELIVEEPRIDYDKAQAAEIERQRERLKIKVDKLFTPDCTDNPFDKDETIRLRKALGEITVLDPACGSGAFPMGVMLRLMELRQIVGHGHRNSYDLKEEILSNNIFGVDIMPMAVEIARLRAWLSLVLESDYKPTDRKNNFGIAALPNLDFKFVCANSLIDNGYDNFIKIDKGNITPELIKLNGEIDKLKRLREQYFDPRGDKQKKDELQGLFRQTKDFIKSDFPSLKKSWNLENFLNRIDDWDPFDDSHVSSFFSPAWMFGINDGFDVVIGNPPYVQIQKMEESRKEELESQKFVTFERTGDLYQLFYEMGIHLLTDNGVISFITSNKWMRANYGTGTRKLFSSATSPISIVDFGMALVFETATILTNILIAKKNGVIEQIPICRIREEDFHDPVELKNYVLQNTIQIENPKEQSWIAYSKKEYQLIKKIEQQGTFLKEWKVQINYGIKTGLNTAFIIDKRIKNKLISEDSKSGDIIKPILRGEDIKAFVPDFAGLYLINSHNGIKNKNLLPINVEKDFPAIYKWLSNFTDDLINRQDHGDHWTNLRNCAYLDEFSKPKIIYPNMTKFLPFIYDESGILTNQKCFILTGEHLKYLTGVFNSILWKFAFRNRFPELLGETFELSKVFFERMPIKKPINNFEKLISERVDQIITKKNLKQNSGTIEKEIDILVYKLYDLNFNDVNEIDKDFWLSEEEYNNFEFR